MTKEERVKQIHSRIFYTALITVDLVSVVIGAKGCADWLNCKADAHELVGLTAGVAEALTEVDTTATVEEEFVEVVEEAPECPYSYYDLELLARVAYAEAGTETDTVMRMVCDVVINRMASESYPDTIYEVVYDSGQYACTWDGNIEKTPSDVAMEVATEALDYYYETGETSLPSNVVGQAGFVPSGWHCYTEISGIYFSYK